MNVLFRELSEITKMLLGGPKTPVECIVLSVVVAVVLILSMQMVGSAMRIPNLGIVRRVLALVVGIFFLLCVWYGVQEYLLPRAEATWLRYAIMIGCPLLAWLAIVTPVQQFIFKSQYVATVITFVISIAVAGIFVILTNAVLGAVAGGEDDSSSIKDRRDSINKIIDQ